MPRLRLTTRQSCVPSQLFCSLSPGRIGASFLFVVFEFRPVSLSNASLSVCVCLSISLPACLPLS